MTTKPKNKNKMSNNFYAHDEQVVNHGQVRGFDGVLYKL